MNCATRQDVYHDRATTEPCPPVVKNFADAMKEILLQIERADRLATSMTEKLGVALAPDTPGPECAFPEVACHSNSSELCQQVMGLATRLQCAVDMCHAVLGRVDLG